MKGLVRKSPGNFRIWVLKMYDAHQREREFFRDRPLSLNQYWNSYKFWLRKIYRNGEYDI